MFERLFHISVDIQCVASTDGYLKIVNPAFTKALGITAEKLLSTPFLDLIHIDDYDKTAKAIKILDLGESISNFENRFKHSDGSYRLFAWFFSVDIETGLIFGSARDVTDSKYTKNKLNQIHRSLNAQSIVAVTDSDGTITEVNDAFCNISGFGRAELIGQNHRILNSGVHPKSFWEEMWMTISSGKTWSGLIENKAKNGDNYFVFSIISPLFDNQGKVESFLAIRHDMTDMIKLKSTLAHTIETLNQTSSIAKVGGWELDIESGELTWTDETFKILDVEKKSDSHPILPEGLELFTPEGKHIVENAVQRAIEFGESYSLEVQAQTAKGKVFWVYTNGEPIYVDGKIVKLSGTIQDINFRKEIEINYELERVKSIQQSKLASLGELSAGIAHEINNPLAIIMGNLGIIKQFINDPEKIEERVFKISKSCDRINQIVKNLKKFSRASDEAKHETIVFQNVVEEAISLAEFKAKEFQTPITLVSNSNCSILCNEIELEQVIINLINNAIDATKDLKDRWVKVSIEESSEFVELRIWDSGRGIPLDVQEKIFDPFFTSKEVGEGTGLGLSITKGIVENHNGTIEIDNDSLNTCFLLKFKKRIE